jgi:predicted 2-oxoglutarate/Fe(II)-dependent dioxygenase YbiX
LAYVYIKTMIFNYTLFLQKNISSALNSNYMKCTHNIRILKYEKNEEIKDHLDVGPNIRASCTLNLNEEYTGGEFTFFSKKHIVTFKTGDAMIFPAEQIWIHGTKPILSGTRYAINCFLKA